MIPMPDTFNGWVNILEKYQKELLVFTYRRGQLIVEGGVKLIGVDGDGDEKESPLKNKMISTIKRIKRSSIVGLSLCIYSSPSLKDIPPTTSTLTWRHQHPFQFLSGRCVLLYCMLHIDKLS